MRYLLILFLLLFSKLIYAQEDKSAYWVYEIRVGANINLNQSLNIKENILTWRQKFPGIKIFGSIIINKKLSSNSILNYGGTIAMYAKSLGNNLNPLQTDIQLDFTNSFSIGIGDGLVDYRKYLRTINNSAAYNISHQFNYAAFIGTNLILNNHGRNQAVGNITLTYRNLSLNYYNDGAVPFTIIPLADNFDRWWTGGLGFYYHSPEGHNRAELNFDQFTGYRPLLYELTSIFGVEVPRYRSDETNDTSTRKAFNSSAYHLRINLDGSAFLDFGFAGSLTYTDNQLNTTYFSLQDILHIMGGTALHPNRDNNKVFLGVTKQQFIYQNFIK